jgi:hypothetical protein
MSATRHRFSKCGHKGFGAFCHRCDTADKLEAKAKTVKKAEPKEGKKVLGLDEAGKLMEEATRLRSVPGASVND